MHRLAFGYNTNGFAHHRLMDAIDVIAECGYDGVALTLDVHHLDPFEARPAEVDAVRARLARHGLRCVVETGARFLLDPRRKHHPTLCSADPEGRRRRLDFIARAVRIARDLGAPVVSLWAGVPEPTLSRADAFRLLADGLGAACAEAERAGLRLALEPEPGMLVETLAEYEEVAKAVDRPGTLGLTLDVGHLVVSEREWGPVVLARGQKALLNVHLDDARGRVHEHLPLGEGDVTWPAVLAGLATGGFAGLASVELSRSSHEAPAAARRAREFLAAVEAQVARCEESDGL